MGCIVSKDNTSESERFVKLTNESCVHHGFKYGEGLNVDVNDVNKYIPGTKIEGGIYFCKYKDAKWWLHYNRKIGLMYWIWDVEIVKGTKLYSLKDTPGPLGTKIYRAQSVILSNKRRILDTDLRYCALTKSPKIMLSHIDEPSKKDYIAALRRCDPHVLKYIKNPDKEIYMFAVSCNGMALKHVPVSEQTDEICLEAVRHNGFSLQFVEEQTEKICMRAIITNPSALKYVKKQTKEMCIEAVKRYPEALEHVKVKSDDVCIEAVKRDATVVKFIENKDKKIQYLTAALGVNQSEIYTLSKKKKKKSSSSRTSYN